MSFRRIIFIILLAVFLASFAFFFNAINEKQLSSQNFSQSLAQKLNKVFANFIINSRIQPKAVVFTVTPTPLAVSQTTPTSTPTPTPTKKPAPPDPFANDPDLKDAAWGQAVQISETGYKMKVGFDAVMATPEDTFKALNVYRYTKGKSNLTWDDRLAKYALERATFVCKNGSDAHAGFSDYVDKQEGYKTLGFYGLGENMSTHMRFIGTHLIEWMYAADPGHDNNQLGDWSHVGVGIYEDCSSLIFANSMI